MSIAFLRVKIKSLAEEARIIKREERKRKWVKSHWEWNDPQHKHQSILGRKAFRYGTVVIDKKHPPLTSLIPEMEATNEHNGLDAYTLVNDQTYFDLRNHRINVVRPAARASLLAYGILRGRSYHQIENRRLKSNKPDEFEIVKVLQTQLHLLRWLETRNNINFSNKDNLRIYVLQWLADGTIHLTWPSQDRPGRDNSAVASAG